MRIPPGAMWLAIVAALFSGNVAAAVLYWHQPPLPMTLGVVDGSGSVVVVPPVPDPPRPNSNPAPPPNPNPAPPNPAPPPLDPPPQKLSGDFLLLLIDTRAFRGASDVWLAALRSVRDDHEGRLLGSGIVVVDKQGRRTWTTKQDFPIERQSFANDAADGAFDAAFKTIRECRSHAVHRDFQTFLVWSSDVNPDSATGKQTLTLPEGWLKLIWQGSPEPSKRLTKLFGDERIVRFKLDRSGLNGTIDFYLRAQRP